MWRVWPAWSVGGRVTPPTVLLWVFAYLLGYGLAFWLVFRAIGQAVGL